MTKIKQQKNVTCNCAVIHEDVVKSVLKEMPDEELLFEVAEFFRIFGDSTRIGILTALSKSEMCGCDLCAILGMTQSAISHQLRILKQARLVRSRKEGKMVYFSLDDEHISDVLKLGLKHISE
jgi:ArsR family transcriptional regulator